MYVFEWLLRRLLVELKGTVIMSMLDLNSAFESSKYLVRMDRLMHSSIVLSCD